MDALQRELGTDHGFPLRFSAKAEQKPGNRGLSPIPPIPKGSGAGSGPMGCAAVDDARAANAKTRNDTGLWNDSHWSERMSGAESRNRTDTVLPPPEFESGASTCSAISAI